MRSADGEVLDGVKRWITNAGVSTYGKTAAEVISADPETRPAYTGVFTQTEGFTGNRTDRGVSLA